MTALIKSTDGTGWVEARVGDKVKSRFGSMPVTGIEKDPGDGCTYIVLWDGEDDLWDDPENCQLIERPFQAGDPVEGLTNSGEWIDITEIINKGVYAAEVFYNFLNTKEAEDFRHSSPLLRPVGGV